MERVGSGADVPELAWVRGIGESIWLERTAQYGVVYGMGCLWS